jgi:hypothetical protein
VEVAVQVQAIGQKFPNKESNGLQVKKDPKSSPKVQKLPQKGGKESPPVVLDCTEGLGLYKT